MPRLCRKVRRSVALGSFTRKERSGRNSVRWNGRLHGRALKPGRYTLKLTPTDPAGNRGRAKSISLKVVKR